MVAASYPGKCVSLSLIQNPKDPFSPPGERVRVR
jgi:hypothetical protein